MILKSFGCSFIFGSDLADETNGEPYERCSASTWPALLAQHLNYDYCCYARPGAGNLRILEKILDQSTVLEPAIFVVSWTWIDRFDYTQQLPENYHAYDRFNNDLWQTIRPGNADRPSRQYYRDLHSQIRDQLTNLIYIKTAIDTLKQKKIPFAMTYIDDLLFEENFIVSPAVKDLQNYVRPYMFQFENQTFLNWAKKYNYPISSKLHPLEQAHCSAADTIKHHFDAILHRV